jgi:hypothetical protein
MASRLERLQSDIHYCYQCFDWVVGEEWEPHCQSHLAGMATKRCGTTTYCHTLVRPGYCPFCIRETALPASKRLESWTRDHKLWSHVSEHLEECRWPRVCPHPLCDTSLKDAAALQYHLVDEHGFSRTCPVKPANMTALDSQDEKIPLDKDTQGARPSRKRKPSSCTRALEWMPSQSFHDTPASPEEPSVCRRQKRPRRTPPAICPTVLSLDEGLSDDHTAYNVTDSVMLSHPYLPSIEDDDKCTDLDCDLFPSNCTKPHDTIDSPEPEDDHDDTLFDRYLCSPSPLPPSSPDDAASEWSGLTLIDAERHQPRGSLELYTETLKSPAREGVLETEEARDHEDPGRACNGPLIRLRVSQPKIMLRLKVRDTSQPGRNKSKGMKREKAKKGIKGRKQKNRSKGEEERKGKKQKRQMGRA